MKAFRVSSVEPGRFRLPAATPREAVGSLLAGPACPLGEATPLELPKIEAAGARRDRIAPARLHGFVEAVGVAYGQHLPLVLSPDDVWLMLTQGFALSTRDAVFDGDKHTLSVRRDDFVLGNPENPWTEVFSAFSEQIRAQVGAPRHRLLVADFSTTGPIERAASEVVLMGALKNAFEYRFSTLCGIPEVTLLGTPADWHDLRDRAGLLCEQGLSWWWKPLRPVLDAFVEASEGRVDPRFWQSIFKLDDSSGGPYVTGWINVLVPFLENEGSIQRNPATTAWAAGMDRQFGGGPRDDKLPSGLTRAPVRWDYLGREVLIDFCAGFVGIEQDVSGAVRPGVGWVVLPR